VQELHEEQLETEAYVETTVSPLSASGKSLGKAWKERFSQLRETLQEKLRAKPPSTPVAPRATTHDPMTLASLRGMNAGHGGSLSAKTRRKIIAGAIGAVVLIGAGVWIHRARQASAEQTLWNAVYTQALDRRNRADADLLYQNDEKARALVNEAFSLAHGLDTKTKEREEAKGKLVQDLEGLRQRLRKEQRVDQPTVVYQTTQGMLSDLLFTNQGLAVIQTDNSSTSLALVTNSVAESVISIPPEATPIASIALTKNGILTLSQQKQLALVSLSRKSAGIVALNSPTAGSSQSMSIYNNRLYIVDGTGKTIWRYTASGNGFGQETAYLKSPVEDLTQATSLAIDSNIYVGLSNGRILKFLSGEQQTWDDAQTDPALTEVTKLWATADGERIVALDAKSKRLAIYNKTGSLIGQIVSNAFEQPTGLTVDPKAKKIFVSDGQKVLQFDLP
jgi:hypothetical protein